MDPKLSIERVQSYATQATQRLSLAFAPVAFVAALVFATVHFQNQNIATTISNYGYQPPEPNEPVGPESDKSYWLIETERYLKKKRKYITNLVAEKDSAASGGFSEKKGNIAATPWSEFSLAETVPRETKRKLKHDKAEAARRRSNDGIIIRLIGEGIGEGAPSSTKMTKIPTNYKGKFGLAMRWDASRQTFVPTIGKGPLAVFLNRINRRVMENIALPGGMPQIYRDPGGCIVLQTVRSQNISMYFMVDRQGNMIDAKVANVPLQPEVGQSFVDAIKDENLGPLPDDLEGDPWIGGITYWIPDLGSLCH